MPLPSELLRRMLAGDRDSARELGRWLDRVQAGEGVRTLRSRLGALSGQVMIDGLIYGAMFAEDISRTVTVAATHVYYPVTGGLSAGLCNGLTFAAGSELVVEVPGRYGTHWSMSLSNSASDQTIEGLVMVNAVGQGQTGNATRAKENGVVYSVSGGNPIVCAAGDVLRLAVENETGPSTITVNHANLFVWRIDAA